ESGRAVVGDREVGRGGDVRGRIANGPVTLVRPAAVGAIAAGHGGASTAVAAGADRAVDSKEGATGRGAVADGGHAAQPVRARAARGHFFDRDVEAGRGSPGGRGADENRGTDPIGRELHRGVVPGRGGDGDLLTRTPAAPATA